MGVHRMKKCIVAAVSALIGIILGITIKGPVGIVLAVLLIVLGILIFLDKIPAINKIFSENEPIEGENNVERQLNLAKSYIEKGNTLDALNTLQQVAEVGVVDEQYAEYSAQALKILGELYEKGTYSLIHVTADKDKAIGYYERYIRIQENGEIFLKIAWDAMNNQNYPKALKNFENAAANGEKAAIMKLGSIYEEGLYKVDVYGNKGDVIIPADLERSRSWYEKLAKVDDEQGKAAFERVDYALNHTDSIEFEEKEKLYAKISERRKNKNIQFRFKAIEGAKLQYQYTYVHDEVEGYLHKLPKDWIKKQSEESEQDYFAPNYNYKDFAIYVTYDSIPKESKRDLELFLRYDNDILDYDLNNLAEYITEYSDGICATYYHKELEKGIVTFAFEQQNRLACLKFVCATMDIIEQYEEVIFEVANSFAFVDPTQVSEESANRKDQQYYSEAVFYYYLEQHDKAMEFAKKALNVGSKEASYLLIELYFDDESPYVDYEKALGLGKQLFESNQDSDLAFLIGTIYEQHHKDYLSALQWYEQADALKHERVPFYLGRIYYYGVLRTKRNGKLALEYFKRALTNGILEAEAYIHDIEELDGEDLQTAIDKWEAQIAQGNAETALKIAVKKKDQVFYLASEEEIEKAFEKACNMGSAEAAYRYGVMCREQEKSEGYEGPCRGIQYLERAFNEGYTEFDDEYLCEIVDRKAKQGLPKDEMTRIYMQAAKNGYEPAVDKVITLLDATSPELIQLYNHLKCDASVGSEAALLAMNKLEKKYSDLLYMAVKEQDGYKLIDTKFFKLSVPKEYTAVVNDEGGTIRIGDSVVDFAVAEMPVHGDDGAEFLKIYKLIISEYMPEENAEVVIVNSRLIGSAMMNLKGNNPNFSILLISAKNQYLFKLCSQDKSELLAFKDKVLQVAKSLVESGETYIATGEKANIQIGLTRLLSSNENGSLCINKLDD